LIFFDQQRLKAALKNMTAASMAAIKPYRVGDQEMTHKLAQIGIGGLNQQMKMIGHQNVSNKFDTESFTAIGQGINKSTAVGVIDKDILATIAPVHHMVIGARILDSQRSCHKPLFTHFINFVNFKDLTPFPRETKELMIQFYKNIQSGQMNRCQALRQAALREMSIVKERYDLENPLFWGAFVFLEQP
jgi:hypothetical protein